MVPSGTVCCFLLVVLEVAAFSTTLRWSRGGMGAKHYFGLALFMFTLSALNILGHFLFSCLSLSGLLHL